MEKNTQKTADGAAAYRIEADTMGEVRVPADRLWGAQTQRSFENFRIGGERMPTDIVRAFGILKKAAALANAQLGVLEQKKAKAIARAADRIIKGELDGEFPLSVWQTGSGTQTNMNVNEVIAHLTGLHPNDDVNRGQSSNDTFPTAMHIAAVSAVEDALLPALDELRLTLDRLAEDFGDIVKIGRTHLQDATPLTLGQEIGAWSSMLSEAGEMIIAALAPVRSLALGGTAVGTGLNTHPDFGKLAADKITEISGHSFRTAPNKFHALTAKDALVFLHGALKALAANLFKIAGDVRLLSSGPRCGIGELVIPANEPGSSIMPGKVNPTQCEALTMVCAQVMGNDAAIGFAASQGHFQLNVYMPVMAYNMQQSIHLLADAAASFDKNCMRGLEPNEPAIAKHLENSLMLVTALTPKIGYDNAAKIAKRAHENGTTLREAALASGHLTEAEYNALVDPTRMV
ncbi:MAG: class II fumarate hydratase [Clostridiales Family XIII bacterium]|jgi:fumarate hydratase class II|nr:class II fumarate hydratase [Clostridiales Family XIII bacterium]